MLAPYKTPFKDLLNDSAIPGILARRIKNLKIRGLIVGNPAGFDSMKILFDQILEHCLKETRTTVYVAKVDENGSSEFSAAMMSRYGTPEQRKEFNTNHGHSMVAMLLLNEFLEKCDFP